MPGIIDPKNIPSELLSLKQWVIARVEPDPTPNDPDHKKKVPRSPFSGEPCTVHGVGFDPQALGTFEEAVAALEKFKCEFVGFCFTGTDYRGLDFDGTFNGQLPNVDHFDVIKAADSFAERSQSRRGVHSVLCAPGTSDPEGQRSRKFNLADGTNIHVFYEGYFVFTGVLHEAKPIRRCSESEWRSLVALAASKKTTKLVGSAPTDVRLRSYTKKLLSGDLKTADTDDHSLAVSKLTQALLVDTMLDREKTDALFKTSWFYSDSSCKWCPRSDDKWQRLGQQTMDDAEPKAREQLLKARGREKPDIDPVDAATWPQEFGPLCDWKVADPVEIVKDLLIFEGIHVFAGLFESAKTMWAFEMADGILRKRKVGNYFEVLTSYPILFLCLDMPPSLQLKYARYFGLDKNPEFLGIRPESSNHVTVDDPRLQAAAKGRILILDTMLDYARIEDAYRSGEWIEFFQKLRDLITIHRCVAIILIAHPTKTGARNTVIDPTEFLKDSVTFGGKIDVAFAFRRIDKTSKIFIERIKGRGFDRPITFTVSTHADDGSSYIERGEFPVIEAPGQAGSLGDHLSAGKVGAPSRNDRDQAKDRIRQWMAEGKTLTKSQLALDLEVPVSTAWRWKQEVEKEADPDTF